MTKVLFLDIDGVLVTKRSIMLMHDAKFIPRAAVDLINKVCADTGAVVVVSSTWRYDADCRKKLRSAGLSAFIHDDWRTPMLHQRDVNGIIHATIRGDEIKAWLDDHPEVTKYAIVDDDSDMLPEQKPFFVQTGFDNGIGPDHAERLIALLS